MDAQPCPLILAVDDSPAILDLIQETLEDEGYRVQTHCGGRGAAEVAARLGPALILLDLSMPDRDGLHVLKDLRAASPTKETPVVLLTAQKDERSMKKAEKLGATRYLTKPFSPLLLVRRIRACLETQTPAPPPGGAR